MKLKQRWNERHRSEDTKFNFGSFQVYFIDYAITVVPFFLLFIPLHPALPLPPACPLLTPQFMSMGCTYKFFGFSISYTILTLPLSILYQPSMLLIPCTFPPFPPSLFPLITLHVTSICVVLFLFYSFAYLFLFLIFFRISC